MVIATVQCKSQAINGIQLLRVIATLMVMMVHFGQSLPLPDMLHRLIALGTYGVDVFFVISGFLIEKSLEHSTNIKHFYLKRFVRIVPVYYAVIILNMIFSFLTANYPEDTLKLGWLRYFLFINTSLPSDNYIYWNNCAAVWTISAFMFFYLIAPIIHKFCNTTNKYLVAVATSMVISVGYKSIIGNISGGDYIATHSPIAVLYELLLGAYMYKCTCIQNKADAKCRTILPIIFLLIAGIYSVHNYIVSATALLALLFCYDLKVLFPIPILNTAINVIDQYSFSIYLGHTTVMFIFSRLQELMCFSNVLLAGLDLAGSVTLIILLHCLIEKPSQKLLALYTS